MSTSYKKNDLIPDETECFLLFKKYGMLENIIKHSVQVKKIATALAEKIIGQDINIRLIKAAALLHDISKTHSIRTGERRHDLAGGKILRDLGYISVAAIVESHVFFEGFTAHGRIEEREIIFYADKRVMHDKIVTIEERINDLLMRYGINDKVRQIITENKKLIAEIEKKIKIGLSADMESIIAGNS